MGKFRPDQNRDASYFNAKPESLKNDKGKKNSFKFNFQSPEFDDSSIEDTFSATGFQKIPTSTDDVV